MSEEKNFSMFRLPTPEEHRAASLAWLSRIQPTLMDQWPKELMALSIPTKLLPIDVDRIWSSLCKFHDGEGVDNGLKGLALALDHYIGWNRKFIRLNSRSPKDNLWPFEVAATVSGKEAVLLLAGSMRVLDDLMEFRWIPEQPASVAIRDFDPRISGWNEFRCFVKDGDLIAVTHYDYTKEAPDRIVKNDKEIREKINAYFAEELKPVLHVGTVVFDLAMMNDMSFVLIEINPYGLSDPCHFQTYKNVEAASSFIEFAPASPKRTRKAEEAS